MLKNINPIVEPELLFILAKMGHGDEIVFSDIHFPAYSCGDYVLQARGCEVSDLVEAVIPLIELDQYVPDKVVMMATVGDDVHPPGLIEEYTSKLPNNTEISFIDRFAFYERAKSAKCIVVTGTTRKYGNIILKKGVTPIL
ncbi:MULTISPECIES: L-fucose mutarotase [Vibrio]|uniref:L-fucose mutarotase n=1 Tax=Vibrio TaxID=662 RepID=UPI0001540E80|nr:MULTISPECIES: L-fucose mutarotase [Vibrio]EDL54911.1 protein of fucose operon [Vibrio mediterranei AK1]KFA95434.1 fucose isomerase [Vibrio sp. ER1A]MCF4176249.1 L-fucose mutarotase [Vibrio sp. McD22-P3]NOH28079.1 L-fucose mutarotase [Vibrio mediterranei]NOI25120.1 L-fucose mutarotase [Vibrio mediterranei]